MSIAKGDIDLPCFTSFIDDLGFHLVHLVENVPHGQTCNCKGNNEHYIADNRALFVLYTCKSEAISTRWNMWECSKITNKLTSVGLFQDHAKIYSDQLLGHRENGSDGEYEDSHTAG